MESRLVFYPMYIHQDSNALLQTEENLDLQTRSAVAVASFIDFCSQHRLAQPPDKIVKNLCTFLCQDIENTPAFVYARQTSGILSFQAVSKPPPQRNGKENTKDKSDSQPADDVLKARLSRRGAGLAFDQLSAKFGPRLLDVIPAMWHSMAGGLLSACATSEP